MAVFNNGTDNYGVTNLIVDPTLGFGNYQTIAAALTAAVSGQTIFIRPGTYTENPTLVAGVNLTAWDTDGANGTVIIKGNCTLSTAGTVNISGIQLQTNSASCLTVSGSAASIVNLSNCFINATNNTAITLSSSSGASKIVCFNCTGDIGTTGIAYFQHSGAGTLLFQDYINANSGASVTAATVSGSGGVQYLNAYINFATTTSSTASLLMEECQVGVTNTTNITVNGTGTNQVLISTFTSGTASAISVGTGATLALNLCLVISSNANAITGAGTLNYSGIVFPTTNTINPTTIARQVFDGGEYKGRTTNTTPSAGMIGEQVRATLASGSATALTSPSSKNVTTISLTAGIWDVTGIVCFTSGASTNVTQQAASISQVTGTVGGNFGDDTTLLTSTAGLVNFGNTLTVPALRISLSATTTIYLVAQATFSVSTYTAFGRISATRVA